jgi:hypothetical protein
VIISQPEGKTYRDCFLKRSRQKRIYIFTNRVYIRRVNDVRVHSWLVISVLNICLPVLSEGYMIKTTSQLRRLNNPVI